MRARLLAAILLVLPALAACSADPSAGQVTLRIGDQGRSTELPLRLSGQLDGLPYKVEFSQFASGPLVNQAIQAGAVDFGTMGDTPAMFAQASGLPVSVVSVTRTDGPGYTLVARPGSGITSVAGLRGRKIAFSKNTANHGFLLRVLDQQGLTQKDITPVDVPLQNVGNVLESGTVDAATVSEETRVKYLKEHPGAVELVNGKTVTPGYGFRLASKAALKDPARRAALKDLTARLVRANAWVKANTEQWIDAYYVKERKQDPATGRLVYAGSGSSTFIPIDAAVAEAQQRQADLFTRNGQLPAKVDIAPQFDQAVISEFNAAVAAAQKG
ncbi:ABC transporter substrate-binding protein [Longispora albida]|uniref:ABC transporter substrate-binding protein n=1 Tax=Longispora albida TaxID=203523 RepID=UPI00035FD4D4|nr:ABC transporter substrate-binding protein [Longispora albida]